MSYMWSPTVSVVDINSHYTLTSKGSGTGGARGAVSVFGCKIPQ